MAAKNALVSLENNQAITTSLIVAERFDKQHRHVLEAIRELIKQAGGVPEIGQTPMFIESSYVNEQNGQTYPMYLMTRDGFSLLAMGFTGKKALDFKLKFINAFNRMEEKLTAAALKQQKLRRCGIDEGRNPVTDAIKGFVERDGIPNPGLYYGTYTKKTQIEVLGIPKGGRDNASGPELALLAIVEGANANQLRRSLENGESFFQALNSRCIPRAELFKQIFIEEGMMDGHHSRLKGAVA